MPSRITPAERDRLQAEGLKRCPRCGTAKGSDAFARNSRSRDGLDSYCRSCNAERSAVGTAAYRERNRQRWETGDPFADSAPKRCPRCLQSRPRSDFSTNPSRPDGLKDYCRPCNASRSAERDARIRGAWVEYVDRATLWARDEGVCYLCGTLADPGRWDLEHIQPISHGGEHSYANAAVSHPACNYVKGGTPWPDVSFYPTS